MIGNHHNDDNDLYLIGETYFRDDLSDRPGLRSLSAERSLELWGGGLGDKLGTSSSGGGVSRNLLRPTRRASLSALRRFLSDRSTSSRRAASSSDSPVELYPS